jgi:hypothetical protein
VLALMPQLIIESNSDMHHRCVLPSGAAALRRGMGRPRHNCPQYKELGELK